MKASERIGYKLGQERIPNNLQSFLKKSGRIWKNS